MKRVKNLFDKVTSFENLLKAFRLAMRGCGKTNPTCRFFYHLESEILKLQAEMIEGSYYPGEYHYFTIYDPKERIIAVAPFRDRVVHHAIVRVLIPVYESTFIFDSYATRAEKGSHAAIKRAQKFTRRWPWYLKADISKYFGSVRHDILLTILERKVNDRQLLSLLDRIIQNTPSGIGLPIGNLTSQFLANVYLDPLDHEIKDNFSKKGYIRYMDDFVLFGYSQEELLDLKSVIELFLSQKLRLCLKMNSTWLNRSSHGLSFLGMRIFPSFIRIRPENRRRTLRRSDNKIKEWDKGMIDEECILQSFNSVISYLRYFSPDVRIDFGVLDI